MFLGKEVAVSKVDLRVRRGMAEQLQVLGVLRFTDPTVDAPWCS